MEPLHGLNPEQRKAVESIDGPLLVLAGAGAGKTRVIAERVKEIIKRGAEPSSILAITFTNKAAAEMRSRIAASSTRVQGSGPFVSTFHSLGLTLIKENRALLGYKRTPAIYDRSDSLREMKRALKAVGAEDIEARVALAVTSRNKGDGITAERFEARAQSFRDKIIATAWLKYEEALRTDQALDFDDLLLKTVEILTRFPATQENCLKRWRYVLVDEYQDTNKIQEDLMELLVGPEKNICVVGDLDQTIYGWRGAKIENIRGFKDKYGARVITLKLNYRSSKNIVEAASALIENNTDRLPKEIDTENPPGELLTHHVAGDGGSEAVFVADTIAEFIKKGHRPKEFAVLYRANSQSREFEHKLNDRSIPNQVLGTRFYDRKEVKDVLSYIRAALYETPADIARATETPGRGIGKVTLLKILQGQPVKGAIGIKVDAFKSLLASIKEATTVLPPTELIKWVIEKSGIEAQLKTDKLEGGERLGNLYELVSAATRHENIESFLEHVALQSEQDEIKEQRDTVRLMTIHAAKGLEFPYVFIVGLEEGLFPLGREENPAETLQEERRLMYVALTRAKHKVFLSTAIMRTIFGKTEMQKTSQFIDELPAHLVKRDESGFMKSATNYLDDIEY